MVMFLTVITGDVRLTVERYLMLPARLCRIYAFAESPEMERGRRLKEVAVGERVEIFRGPPTLENFAIDEIPAGSVRFSVYLLERVDHMLNVDE